MLKTIHSPQFDDHLVMQCQMISCPAFLAAVQVTNINSRFLNFSLSCACVTLDESSMLFNTPKAFGEVIEVNCLTGYRCVRLLKYMNDTLV